MGASFIVCAAHGVPQPGTAARFKGRSIDSHHSTFGRCRRMLALFEPMRVKLVGQGLSVAQVITLMKA